MPYTQQITNFITQVGSWVGPILLTVWSIYLSVKEIYAFFARRRAIKDSKLTNQLLGQLIQSKDSEAITKNTETVEELQKENEELRQLLKTESNTMKAQSAVLGEMFSIVFENSTLPYETKEKLRMLKTKLDCPSESTLLEEVLSQNAILRESFEHIKTEYENLKQKQEVKIVSDAEADTAPVQPLVNTIIQ